MSRRAKIECWLNKDGAEKWIRQICQEITSHKSNEVFSSKRLNPILLLHSLWLWPSWLLIYSILPELTMDKIILIDRNLHEELSSVSDVLTVSVDRQVVLYHSYSNLLIDFYPLKTQNYSRPIYLNPKYYPGR